MLQLALAVAFVAFGVEWVPSGINGLRGKALVGRAGVACSGAGTKVYLSITHAHARKSTAVPPPALG